jgi:hypothetical protein
MGYFLITDQQRGRCQVSWHLQNQVCANADQGFYKSATQFAVMRALASFADDDGGSCFPSHATLAKKSGCSRHTVIRMLEKFRTEKWIDVPGRRVHGRQNRYQILEHGCVNREEAAKAAKTAKETSPKKMSQTATSVVASCDNCCSKLEHNSYQVLSSSTKPPPKAPNGAGAPGVVVVFDFEEEEEVTEGKALKDARPIQSLIFGSRCRLRRRLPGFPRTSPITHRH